MTDTHTVEPDFVSGHPTPYVPRCRRKNDRTVLTLIPSRCDISFAEHPSAHKASIRL